MINDIARLPKWAQKEIEYLRRDLASAKAELCEIREKAFGGTGIVSVEKFSINEPNLVLPDRSLIRFGFGDLWHEGITVNHDNTGIKIMGGSSLTVIPEVTNVIKVEFRK